MIELAVFHRFGWIGLAVYAAAALPLFGFIGWRLGGWLGERWRG